MIENKNNKVKFYQKFYSIENIGFFYPIDKTIIEKAEDKYIYYNWVSPVYVYSINKIFDGSETFDICPVDFSKTIGSNWKWRIGIEYSEIGNRIFNTEKEAWEKYHEKYNNNVFKTDKEKRRIHFLIKNDSTLIQDTKESL